MLPIVCPYFCQNTGSECSQRKRRIAYIFLAAFFYIRFTITSSALVACHSFNPSAIFNSESRYSARFRLCRLIINVNLCHCDPPTCPSMYLSVLGSISMPATMDPLVQPSPTPRRSADPTRGIAASLMFQLVLFCPCSNLQN